MALIGDGDRLDPDLLATVDAAISKAPEADFAYTDEDEIDARGRHSSPTLKPGWSPDRLPVEMYTGRLAFLRRTLLEEVGGFSADLGDAAAEWDIALRVTEAARAVLHIPALSTTGGPAGMTASGRGARSGCAWCRPTATGSGCRPGSRRTRFAREGAGCSRH